MSTKIEWTDETWTPIRARNRETGKVGHFCVHKSPGCINCYSETWQARFGNPVRFAAQDAGKVDLFLDKDMLNKVLGWRKPRMVFVCSMTDLFLENHPDEWIVDVWANMMLAQKHTFQVLTKRTERMTELLNSQAFQDAVAEIVEAVGCMALPGWPTKLEWPVPNVWVGTSVEDRARKDRFDHLRNTPAAVRFLSIEPLLEDLGEVDLTGIHWVIVGGESGNKARPMNPDWVRSIRDQCLAADVAFFFKQWGTWECAEDVGSCELELTIESLYGRGRGWFGEKLRVPEWFTDGEATYVKVGKKASGRELDGRTWEEMPA